MNIISGSELESESLFGFSNYFIRHPIIVVVHNRCREDYSAEGRKT